ncbi:MAG: hypothetical protein [Caudoviricetes sp.]|nr:MAG: hypothetical protein [Caudoviricetes sp.]
MEKPDYLEQFVTYLIVIALAAFGGVVKAIRKYQSIGGSMSLKVLLLKVCLDLIVAVFAGLMMFLWLQRGVHEIALNPESAFYIAIAGYMGGQAIDIFVTIWQAVTKAGSNKK